MSEVAAAYSINKMAHLESSFSGPAVAKKVFSKKVGLCGLCELGQHCRRDEIEDLEGSVSYVKDHLF